MFVPCIPWSTDAPVDHRPYGTVGLMALAVYVFSARVLPGSWCLPDADGAALMVGVLNPFIWLTTNLHGGHWLRLLVDLLFLWTFGLIVEGKLGWYRYLPTCAVLVVGQSLLSQAIADQLQPHVGVSLAAVGAYGSTSLVYGIAAMAVVWAPKNDVRCAAWIWIKGYVYDMPVTAVFTVFVLADVGLAWMSGAGADVALAHATGFVLGLVAGALLLAIRQVNCQGWDLLSVASGKTGDVDLDEMRKYQNPRDDQSGLDEDYFTRRHHAVIEILRTHLANRDATAALELHLRMTGKMKDWQLPEAELCGLIQLLNERRSFPASIPLMFEYLRRFPGHSGPMRLELARILLHEENRPGKAAGVLERIPEGALPEELAPIRDELLREAHEKSIDGEIELEEDT